MISWLFEIVSLSVGSLFWGVLVAAACMALFVALAKGWYKNATLSPAVYVVGALLFLYLSLYCTFIVGELKIMSSAADYKDYLASLLQAAGATGDEWLSQSNAQPVLDSLFEHYPILDHFLTDYHYQGSVAELPETMINLFTDIVRREIWSDAAHCLGAAVVAAVVVVLCMRNRKGGGNGIDRNGCSDTPMTMDYTPSGDTF